MRRAALFGGWTLVVVLATTLTWQIVGAADDQVSDRPASPLNVAAPELTAGSSSESTTSEATDSLPTSTSTTIPEPSTSTTATPLTTTTVRSTTSSTSGSGSPTTSIPTPESTSSTTTSTVSSSWSVKTISTDGGTVIVEYRPEEVVLQAASPKPGFRAEVEKTGPPEVKVEFESESTKVEVSAKWSDDELDVEISADDDH